MITLEQIKSLGYVEHYNYSSSIEYRINNNLNIAILYMVDGPHKGTVRQCDNSEMAWSMYGSIIETFEELKQYTTESITSEIMLLDEYINEATNSKQKLQEAFNKIN